MVSMTSSFVGSLQIMALNTSPKCPKSQVEIKNIYIQTMFAIRADDIQIASHRLKNARSAGLRPYARRPSLEQPRSNYLESAVVKANTRPARRTELPN